VANQRTDSKGSGTVKVTLVRSPIGFDGQQGVVVRSMGLRRIRHTVELKDTAATRGLIHKVRHLVTVDEGTKTAPSAAPTQPRRKRI
jgi:large subunit ribosomal protein L30